MSEPYHLFKCTSTEINALRALSDAEIRSYRDALEHLREFDNSPGYLELIARNEVEFNEVAAVWSGAGEVLVRDTAFRKHQEIEFNRRLINYLSAARLLLDHYEMRLKRRYGEGSAQVNGFKSECAAAYDGDFAYRFLYKLRNFAQHFGMPARHVHARSRLHDPTTKTTSYEASIQLDVGELLSHGGDVWGKVGPELESLRPLISVHPYIPRMTALLNRIVSRTQTLERPKLMDTAKVVVTIMRDAIGPDQTPAIGTMRYDPPKTDFQFIQPPFRLMQWLGLTGFDNPL